MKTISELIKEIISGNYDGVFEKLYSETPTNLCHERYISLLNMFKIEFGDRPAVIVSAPGRTEVGGNHTDHQHGNVLAAAVNLDIICVASPNNDSIIRIKSAEYPTDVVELNDLSVHESENGRSASLIRGIAAWFSDRGTTPSGFDACTTSDVLAGSGLSSSAAFEVCVGAVMNLLWNGGKNNVELAMAGQFAENKYFGKPSGLMDQMASAVGGFIQIDFLDTANPKIRPVSFDLTSHGYYLCIVDTKGNHADLTPDYAAIPAEMSRVAVFFGEKHLRCVNEQDFKERITGIRISAGDRAVLRAMHFFRDNKIAVDMADALENDDIERFFDDVIRSGKSSFMYLQNVYSINSPAQQGLSLALALSEEILDGNGAWRVHGGGFAGTIQAFVPNDLLKQYSETMNSVFGENACQTLLIRPVGAIEIKIERG